jgi:taurine dioxygenase
MGGDTIWVNMAQAYAGLPDDVKARIDGLEAVHDLMPGFGARMSPEERLVNREKFPPATHPVVRTHPESGEKILYVSEGFVTHLANYGAHIQYRVGADFRLGRLRSAAVPSIGRPRCPNIRSG